MNRRAVLASAAIGITTVAVGSAVLTEPAFAAPTDPANPTGAVSPATGEDAKVADAGDDPIEPVGGAGVFDVDVDQSTVSQDPTVVVTGDVTVMTEDWEF